MPTTTASVTKAPAAIWTALSICNILLCIPAGSVTKPAGGDVLICWLGHGQYDQCQYPQHQPPEHHDVDGSVVFLGLFRWLGSIGPFVRVSR